MNKEDARIAIHDVLEEMAAFMAQASPPDLSEADTRAYFVEPIIRALGWIGIGVVQREYYVRSSQEFIDFVMSVSEHRALAVETKRIKTQLSEKNAAQLVQYCSVEGIEWAILTNGRYWQAFNIYLRPGIQAKRLFQLDMSALHDEAEFTSAFEQMWLFSRDGFPDTIRAWLDNRLLSKALCEILFNPSSRTIQMAAEELRSSGLTIRPHEVVDWLRGRLDQPYQSDEIVASAPDVGSIEPKVVSTPSPALILRSEPDNLAPTEREGVPSRKRDHGTKHYYGIRLDHLVKSKVLLAGTTVVLMARGEVVATGEVNAEGNIVYQGRQYPTPSHPDFARLQGRQATNGWNSWHAILPEGRLSLLELRERYLKPESP